MGSGLWVLPTKIYHYKLKKIDIKRNKLFCKMIFIIVEAIQTRGMLLSFWFLVNYVTSYPNILHNTLIIVLYLFLTMSNNPY